MIARLTRNSVTALLLLAAASVASAETYDYSFGDTFGGSTIGGSYEGSFHMDNTPTSSECDASLSATGTWMSSSYSLFSAEYTASNTLGTGSAEATVSYMGSVVYHKSLSKSWKWSWSKSKTVFKKDVTFTVFGAPVSLSTDCKWEAKAGLNLALTPTGCGADGSATFALKASGSAGITSGLVSGSLVVKVAVVEVKPKGELNANFSYLYASGSVKATASIDLTYSLSLFGFEIGSGSLYKEKVYDKTWTWTKGLTAGARATLAAGH